MGLSPALLRDITERLGCAALEKVVRVAPQIIPSVDVGARDSHDLCRNDCPTLLSLKHQREGALPPISAFRVACSSGSTDTAETVIRLFTRWAEGRTRTMFMWAAAREASDAAARGDVALVSLMVRAGLAGWSKDIIELLYLSRNEPAQACASRLDEDHGVLKGILWDAVERRDDKIAAALSSRVPAVIAGDFATAKAFFQCPSAARGPEPDWRVIKFAWERFGCIPKLPDPQDALWEAMRFRDAAALQFFDSLPRGAMEDTL
jgi:hypothetical protein